MLNSILQPAHKFLVTLFAMVCLVIVGVASGETPAKVGIGAQAEAIIDANTLRQDANKTNLNEQLESLKKEIIPLLYSCDLVSFMFGVLVTRLSKVDLVCVL